MVAERSAIDTKDEGRSRWVMPKNLGTPQEVPFSNEPAHAF